MIDLAFVGNQAFNYSKMHWTLVSTCSVIKLPVENQEDL